jgi:hypothetical protein
MIQIPSKDDVDFSRRGDVNARGKKPVTVSSSHYNFSSGADKYFAKHGT